MSFKIGFIGTGVMGNSMAGHLIDAGHSLKIHTRTKSKAEELLKKGAEWADSIPDLSKGCDAIITMVGYPTDVEEVYLSDNGIVRNADPGTLLIDMTTSDPTLAQRVSAAADENDLDALDAPVSGGDIGAREARLSIMVGGGADAFDKALPLFETMGKSIIHQGKPGSGQHTKMCNQIAVASGMIAMCEALGYAKHAGLDQSKVLETISSGAAGSWSLNNLGPRILKDDYSPGFFIKHFIKDLKIAIEAAEKMPIEIPGTHLAHELYEVIAENGGGDHGTQALYKLFE